MDHSTTPRVVYNVPLAQRPPYLEPSFGHMLLRTLVFFAFCVHVCGWADEIDDRAADRCRSLLNSSLVDFYLPHSIDTQYGGYLEVLDEGGQFTGGEKFLTLQARQMWFFSALAKAGVRREQSLAAAKSGYEFLRKHFYDKSHGGFFAKTARDGSPTDRRKHIYPNAFVIYAMVEYHRATQEHAPLEVAVELFETMEQHCYDRKYGGYNEFFSEEWRLITDPKESGYVGAVGTKTYNSHLHLLEAFAQLYRDTGNTLVGRRLAELIQINTLTVRHPNHPCNIDAWHPDWSIVKTPRNLRGSYGHDVECAWLVIDAAEALGQKPALLRSWAKSLCDHAIHRGYDEDHGGFFYSGPVGQPSDDRKKEWWTQTEALVAMLTLYQMTGESQYRDRFDGTFAFVSEHQVAPDGGWYATLNEDGSVLNPRRSSMWQGAYHSARALLLCERMLRQP